MFSKTMIIYNKYIPVKGYKAMAIYPIIFVRGYSISPITINHEKIHFKQQKELLLIFFYILYFIFYIIYGYKKNPFELEASTKAIDFKYIENRKLFSWLKYFNYGS